MTDAASSADPGVEAAAPEASPRRAIPGAEPASPEASVAAASAPAAAASRAEGSAAANGEERSVTRVFASAGGSLPRSITLLMSAVSSWRLPEAPGEMPLYVQKQFLVKTFSLVCAQLLLIFLEMVVLQWTLPLRLDKDVVAIMFIAASMFMMTMVLCLYLAKDNFPLNYALLLLTTIVAGLFWAVAPIGFDIHLHFQVIGILAAAMAVCAGVVAVLSRTTIRPRVALSASYLSGCFVGSVLDALVVYHWELSTPRGAIVAMLIASVVLATVLLFGMRPLTKCDPDEFFQVVVAMDAALLVASMPFLGMFGFVMTLLAQAGQDAQDTQIPDDFAAEP